MHYGLIWLHERLSRGFTLTSLLRWVGWISFLGTLIGALIILVARSPSSLVSMYEANPDVWAKELMAERIRVGMYPSATVLLAAVVESFVVACLCWGQAAAFEI